MEELVKVSLFPRLFKTECQESTYEEIIILIRRRRWQKEITAYRLALNSGQKEDARRLKGMLPGFTPSGVFRGGHKASQLDKYNGTMGLDFDDVENLPLMKQAFRAMPATLGYFVSPGGQGLKVFVRVDSPAEHHRSAYPYVAAAYEAASGCRSDEKCKDISRCCYVSDDEDAYYNPRAEVFHIPSEEEEAAGRLTQFVDDFLARNPPLPGNRNETVYRLGCEANRRGFPEAGIASCCTSRMQAPDFTAPEIEQALHSAYQGNREEQGSRSGSLGQNRSKKAPATILPEAPLSEEPEGEEGERLREQTPYLPDGIWAKLPPLLREVSGFYGEPRERDMALLSAITVLSACLPGVFGVYNRKRVYTHLYSVLIAPAATGKGCVNDMRRLAERYAGVIEAETERDAKDYLQALEEWELKRAEAHRKHQPVDMKEAPVPAAVSYLFIPAQVTKAKLLVHLRDNGELGGLMVDSEVDTIVTASSMDYGMFEDLLRKFFHHEPIASSRKTDNEYIRIAWPRLALLLAGTPSQYPRLVPDAGNGLHSRLLLYTCRTKAVWQDVSPEAGKSDMESRLSTLSEQVMEMALKFRSKPFQVCLTASQWMKLNNTFGSLLHEADMFGDEEFLSVVKRYGLIAYRICMVFTALRCHVEGYGLDRQYCTDEHFETALSIVRACLEHSRLLLTQIKRDTAMPELSCPLHGLRLLHALPECFTLQEAYIQGAVQKMSEREVRRFIQKLSPLYINRIGRGSYQKKGTIELPGVAGA